MSYKRISSVNLKDDVKVNDKVIFVPYFGVNFIELTVTKVLKTKFITSHPFDRSKTMEWDTCGNPKGATSTRCEPFVLPVCDENIEWKNVKIQEDLEQRKIKDARNQVMSFVNSLNPKSPLWLKLQEIL